MSPRSMGYAMHAVLHAVADGYSYGFDIIERTGLPSGTVYPALATLCRRGLLKSRWESERAAASAARPRRRYYRITSAGRAELAEATEKLRVLGLVRWPRGARPDPADG